MSSQHQSKKRVQLSIDNKRENGEYAKKKSTLNHADIAKHFNDKYNFNMNQNINKKSYVNSLLLLLLLIKTYCVTYVIDHMTIDESLYTVTPP